MQKIVINGCFGGFGLSHKAVMRYAEIKGMQLYPWIDRIHKEVYGKDAVVGNEKVMHHYSTAPVIGENYEEGSYFSPGDIPRDDPALIQLVKELGKKANGEYAELEIVEIPDDIDWEIEEYDG